MSHHLTNMVRQGLSHSDTAGDVMSPFYADGRVELSENDQARVKALLGKE